MTLTRRQIIILAILRRRLRRKKRAPRFWMRPIYAKRKTKGEFHCLVQEMKLGDHELFFKQFRMLPTKLEELLRWVAPKIIKSNIKRESISAEERLCVTLRFLASGDSQSTISGSYRISRSSISRIIRETTQALWDVLLEQDFLEIPKTENDWRKIAADFEELWNFPHCLGAIDGKHISMQAPDNSGSLFFNYKKTFSIVLLAICNARYQFTMVDIGEAGRQSDGGVFANSNIGYSIVNNLLSLPEAELLPNSNIVFPYVFVGDDAFPLRFNLIKPYSNKTMNMHQVIANYRICRARRIIENSFGILASRFRIFRRPIIAEVETVESITKACVALRNYLMKGSPQHESTNCPPGFVDFERNNQIVRGAWRNEVYNETGFRELKRTGSNNFSKNAKDVRENVNSEAGRVPWQNDMISVNRYI